jgi:hypothetical protein
VSGRILGAKMRAGNFRKADRAAVGEADRAEAETGAVESSSIRMETLWRLC